MRGTRTALLVVAAWLVLTGSSAWADRPECPPTKPGACFRDINPLGLFVFILDFDGELLIMGPMDREQDFELIRPDQGGFDVFQINRDTGFLYCSSFDLITFSCVGDELEGSGHVAAHVHLSDTFALGCPSTAHVHGTVDGRRLSGSLMTVGKKSCRLHHNELELKD